MCVLQKRRRIKITQKIFISLYFFLVITWKSSARLPNVVPAVWVIFWNNIARTWDGSDELSMINVFEPATSPNAHWQVNFQNNNNNNNIYIFISKLIRFKYIYKKNKILTKLVLAQEQATAQSRWIPANDREFQHAARCASAPCDSETRSLLTRRLRSALQASAKATVQW